MVLTGHSQGGAIATVAAIALAKYNPMLITFAQPRVHGHNCDVIDNMDTYLGVNAICEVRGGPVYDSITYMGGSRAKQTGTFIVAGAGGAATLGYNTDQWLMPILPGECHNIHDDYETVVRSLKAGAFDGFVEGSLCTRHIKCKSNRCVRDRCVAAAKV